MLLCTVKKYTRPDKWYLIEIKQFLTICFFIYFSCNIFYPVRIDQTPTLLSLAPPLDRSCRLMKLKLFFGVQRCLPFIKVTLRTQKKNVILFKPFLSCLLLNGEYMYER